MIFFVLINAYYGGAMTMFFTSERKIHMESIRDVLRDETWELIIQKGCWLAYHKTLNRQCGVQSFFSGNEALYLYYRDAGDPDYLSLFDRIRDYPEDTLYDNVGHGLEMIGSGR